MSRELARRSRSVPVGPGRKYSPTRLRLILNKIAEIPVAINACAAAGISTGSLRYYLAKSEAGQLPVLLWNGETKPFHEHYRDALDTGVDLVEKAAFVRATGYQEPGVHQGRVQYRFDPDLIALGFVGEAAYLRDSKGQPIPEMITKQDPDMIQFILKNRRPEVYGNKQSIDVNHKGGVLVLHERADISPEAFEKKHGGSKEIVDVEFEEIEDNTTEDK